MGTFGRAGVNKAGSEDDLDMKLVSVTAGDCRRLRTQFNV